MSLSVRQEGMSLSTELTPGQWEYICCSCVVKMGRSRVFITYQCQFCGNTNLRFIHTLEHSENKRQISVGLECARVLMDGSEIPRLAENETKRKERWRIHYRKPGTCVTGIEDLIKRGKL